MGCAVQLLRRYRQQLREQDVQIRQQDSLLEQSAKRLHAYEAQLQQELLRSTQLADKSSKYEARLRDNQHRCVPGYPCASALGPSSCCASHSDATVCDRHNPLPNSGIVGCAVNADT